MTFHDHFSGHASDYSRFRPGYPREFFAELARLVPQQDCAWDCGTGNGQAAVELAEFFQQVIGTDASAKQVVEARPHPRVSYLVCPAEACPLADRSVDLVTVAQAVHWFNYERFYAEVRRVTRPGGALVVWAYALGQITPEVDAVVWRLYSEIVGKYWPPERQVIMDRYETIPFPFPEIRLPPTEMTARWNLSDLIGYLGTWSATQRYIADQGTDPLTLVRAELEQAWGPPETSRQVVWPWYVRAGRID